MGREGGISSKMYGFVLVFVFVFCIRIRRVGRIFYILFVRTLSMFLTSLSAKLFIHGSGDIVRKYSSLHESLYPQYLKCPRLLAKVNSESFYLKRSQGWNQ